MGEWIIAYFVIGAAGFFIFHRFIRDGSDDAGDHLTGFLILILWPVVVGAFALGTAVIGIVDIGNRIRGKR